MLTTSHINPARTEFGDQFTQREPDSITVEEGDLLYGLVRMCKPRLAIETGTGHAIATKRIGQALRANRHGFLISCDTEPEYVEAARKNTKQLPVDIRCTSGLKTLESFDGQKAQFILVDAGDAANRLKEIELIIEKGILSPGGIIVLHDALNPKYKSILEYTRSAFDWTIFESLAGIAIGKHAAL